MQLEKQLGMNPSTVLTYKYCERIRTFMHVQFQNQLIKQWTTNHEAFLKLK
jgi:hypothetical protein